MAVITTGDIAMPVLGFGTVRLAGETCREAVRHALELGYRNIDTAQRYGNETEVGEGLARSDVDRHNLFVTTKLDFPNYTTRGVAAGTRESLDRLGTEYLDLLLIHWPSAEVPVEETLEAMVAQRDAGLVRHIGVSNFTPTMLKRARQVAPVAVNQVEYHPYLSQEHLLRAHAELEVVMTAYCPIARGAVLDDPVLAGIAAEVRRSVPQVVLRWLVQQNLVTAVIRSSNAGRREENADIFHFQLDDEQMARIFRLARGLRVIEPEFAPDWST